MGQSLSEQLQHRGVPHEGLEFRTGAGSLLLCARGGFMGWISPNFIPRTAVYFKEIILDIKILRFSFLPRALP